MDFEQALVFELQTIIGLDSKVFPQIAPENTLPPLIVYISSEGEPIMTLSGPSDMTELSCEIHLDTQTYEQLKSLSKATLDRVRSFFSRPIGENGPVIKSITVTEPIEDIDTATNYYKCSFDIRVRY
jgi:hypothetical protein